jgi:hypothetical protein
MKQRQRKPIVIESISWLILSSLLFSLLILISELTRKAHSDSLNNTASMVYLCLLKVQLALSTLPSPTGVGTILSTRDALNLAITTAEKYCDRLNPCDVLDILPPSAPLALLQTFLSKSIESANSRKRNLQVYSSSPCAQHTLCLSSSS